jgi:type II secretory pathway pseudopilin PulG
LVSIFIIILMSGIIFTNYRQSGQQFALQRSASKLALDIRRAQEMAMSAKEFNGMIPPGGYGVYFKINENWYTLFADCNNNGLYDDPSTTTPCSGFPETVEGNIVIEKPVWICEVCGLGVDEQIILFTPPEPKVTLSPAQDSSTVIVLRNDGQTKTVRVNKAGLIEIE